MDMMWQMPGMVVISFVFWGFIVAAVVAAAWWLLRRSRPRRPDIALDVLQEHYAQGEITEEEFEPRRRDLAA
jgi:uncharacterized membrane protein